MEHFFNEVFVFQDTDFITMARVALAFILGGIVGYERERVQRPAGLRTHMLVCAGSACFTVASVFGFDELGTVRDPARLAAQIITGIGFLGAGTIFRTGSTVRGLTTASSIWITAAIGIVAGLGLVLLAVFTTMLTWIALFMLKGFEPRKAKAIRMAGEPSLLATAQKEEEEDD
ncbi:MAG TPA: MgtC/SapB family protein [Chloroflexia bacterium]|jgi:putative Mg2+ transporter-C (MgtC) family protein